MISFRNYVLEDRQKTSTKFVNLLKKWVFGAKRGRNNDLVATQIAKYPIAKESTRGIIGNAGLHLRPMIKDEVQTLIEEKKIPVRNKVMSLANSVSGIEYFEDIRRMNGLVFEIRITQQNALFDAVKMMERVQDTTGDYDTFEPYLKEDEIVISSPSYLTLDQVVGTMVGGKYTNLMVGNKEKALANWKDVDRW